MVLNGMKVKFYHLVKRTMSLPAHTKCTLTVGEEEYVGKAFLALGDNYCKETGRRLSLMRAMKKAGFNKEQRTAVWEAYRTSKATPRWKSECKIKSRVKV